jgi:hypothetical protein
MLNTCLTANATRRTNIESAACNEANWSQFLPDPDDGDAGEWQDWPPAEGSDQERRIAK